MTKAQLAALSNKDKFRFGLSMIKKLIEYYGCESDAWTDFLDHLNDYLLIDFYSSAEGKFSKTWTPSLYSPSEILEPVYLPDKNGKDFYPCDICKKRNFLFAEYGAESGFCLNFKECGYVKDHYRYNRPDKTPLSVGKYKEYYDLFMSADISLLRVIYDTLSLTDETPGELFEGDRMPIIEDILSTVAFLEDRKSEGRG